MLDLERFVAGVHEYIGKALQPFATRLKALEEREPEPGKPGKDADPAEIAKAVDQAVAVAVAAIPPPKDGTSVTLDDVRPLVDEAVKALPRPQDGKDGPSEAQVREMVAEAVRAIPAPKDGASVTLADALPALEAAVVGWLAQNPPKDGKSVCAEDVLPPLVDEVRAAIAALPVPKDGKGVTVEDFRQLFEAEQAKWALDFERRAQDMMQRAVDRLPKPKDGVDGVGFDDMQVEHDGEGLVTIRYIRGDVVKEFPIRFPCFADRGVFKDGTVYRAGQGVTWGGSYFLAQKDAPQGKPGESDDWRLAVKRGRDARVKP